jgi:hypothetical protein
MIPNTKQILDSALDLSELAEIHDGKSGEMWPGTPWTTKSPGAHDEDAANGALSRRLHGVLHPSRPCRSSLTTRSKETDS